MATYTEEFLRSESLQAVLEARAFAYRLLAQAFLAEPTPEQVEALAKADAVRLFPYAEESELIARGMAEAAAWLDDSARDFDSLHWDYTRMFIGPGRLEAPPWESAYVGEDRLLFQEQTLAVRRVFTAYGLGNPGAPSEPDDHMGLELDFMYRTCLLALQQAAAGQGSAVAQVLLDQQAFLKEHLLAWAPSFAADVVKHAQTGYYRGVGHLLAGFLTVDKQVMAELLQAAR